MTSHKVAALDPVLHKMHEWLAAIAGELATDDPNHAYMALRATLHALRDRLPLEETAQLSAQLPLLVRGVFFESWDPTGKPLRIRSQTEFLERVGRQVVNPRFTPEQACRAVFAVLEREISDGEIRQVQQALPGPIRRLWPSCRDREEAGGASAAH